MTSASELRSACSLEAAVAGAALWQNYVGALVYEERPGRHVTDPDMVAGREGGYQANTVEERERIHEAKHIARQQSADAW